MSKIEPITKMTFKGDSNSREWQIMDKLTEVIIQLNIISEWAENIAKFSKEDLEKRGKL